MLVDALDRGFMSEDMADKSDEVSYAHGGGSGAKKVYRVESSLVWSAEWRVRALTHGPVTQRFREREEGARLPKFVSATSHFGSPRDDPVHDGYSDDSTTTPTA